jgi:hypothetical protein
MSASDAAPLPRLGEVFFDVRGNSRSMRLSWYADTGVAVFSIWQGGMCTGTFRLPIDDLPRMIEILQRGPVGGDEHGHHDHGHHDYGRRAVDAGGPGYAEPTYGDYEGGYPADHDAPTDYGRADYGPGEYDRSAHGTERNRRPGYGADERGPGGHSAGGHRAGGHRAGGDRAGDYRPGEHGSGDEYGLPDHGAGDYGPGDGDYGPGDYRAGYTGGDPGYGDGAYRDPGHRADGYGADGYGTEGYGTEGYGADGYGRPDYEQMPGAPRPARWRDDDRYQADATGQHSVADETGYGQQRFVPPYVSPQPGSSQAGYSDDPEYRLPADPRSGTPHSAARPGGRQG